MLGQQEVKKVHLLAEVIYDSGHQGIGKSIYLKEFFHDFLDYR